MKKTFIRIISPITVGVICLLDIAVIVFGVYAYQRVTAQNDMWTIAFIIIEVIAILLAILVTKEVLSHGIRIDDKCVEFTGLDDNNIFNFDDIEKIESNKDTKASLKKNFVDRYSSIIIYLRDESVITIELGLTTTKTLRKVEKAINEKINEQ